MPHPGEGPHRPDPQVEALNRLISTAPQGIQLLLNDPELLAGLGAEELAILSGFITKQARLLNRIYGESDGFRIRNDVLNEAIRRGLTLTSAQREDALQLIQDNLLNRNRPLGDLLIFIGDAGDTLTETDIQTLMGTVVDLEGFITVNPGAATFERQFTMATDVAEVLGKITAQEANLLKGLPAEKVRQIRIEGRLALSVPTAGVRQSLTAAQEGAFGFLQDFDSKRFGLINSGQFTSGSFPLDLFRAAQADTPESISAGTNLFPVSPNHPSRIEGAVKQQRLEELLGPEVKNLKPGIEFLLQDAGLPFDPQTVEEGPNRQALTRAINELTALAETNRNQLMASTLRDDQEAFANQMVETINDFITSPTGETSQFALAEQGRIEEQRVSEARESFEKLPTSRADIESLVRNRLGSLKDTVTDEFFQAMVSAVGGAVSQIQQRPEDILGAAVSGDISTDLNSILDQAIAPFLSDEAMLFAQQEFTQQEALGELRTSVETDKGITAAIERALGGVSLTAGGGERIGGPGLRGAGVASPQAQQVAQQNILNRIFNKLAGPISQEIQTVDDPDLPGVVERILSPQDRALLGNIGISTGAQVPGGIPRLPEGFGQPAISLLSPEELGPDDPAPRGRPTSRKFLPAAAPDQTGLNLNFEGQSLALSEIAGDDQDLQRFLSGRLGGLLQSFVTQSRESEQERRLSLRDRDVSFEFNRETGKIERNVGPRRRPTVIPGQPQFRAQEFNFSEFIRGRSGGLTQAFEASPVFRQREEQKRRALLRGSGPARFLPRAA